MKFKYVKTTVLGTLFFLFAGCSKSNPLNPLGDCGSDSWTEAVSNDLSAFSAALDAYNNNPSVENCNAYKAAGDNYLDALEDTRDCVVLGAEVAFQAAIDEAQADLANLNCEVSQ